MTTTFHWSLSHLRMIPIGEALNRNESAVLLKMLRGQIKEPNKTAGRLVSPHGQRSGRSMTNKLFFAR